MDKSSKIDIIKKKLPKFIKIYINNIGKLKDLCSSVIAGLLSGTAIGIFFSLTTDFTFNRWINLFSYEIFAAIVYVIFILVLLLIFYGLGLLITRSFWKDKRRPYGFYLNFVAGIYSSAITFLLVLYYNQPKIRNTIAITGLLLFFVLAHFTIKKKWPK